MRFRGIVKIKLKKPFTADSGDVVDEVITCSDYPTVKIVLAGRKHKDGGLSLAEQIRVWCQLSANEIERLAWSDYEILIKHYETMFQTSEEAAETDSPKAPKKAQSQAA